MKKTAIILILTAILGPVQAKEHFYSQISSGYSIWKPMSLDANQSNPFQKISSTSTSMHVNVIMKILSNHALRTGYFRWKQNGAGTENFEQVLLHHLSLDFMSLVIPESPVSPYVSYGISTVFYKQDSNPLFQTGPGYQVGAGLYLHFHRRIALTSEYQFIYLMLPQNIGQTNNYSGPKLSVSLHFCL